jgi:Xaa-Pro aminopeptidase
MNLRIKNILAKLERERLDALFVSSPANISYLTKFTSRDSYLLISKRQNLYFTDSRYIEEAKSKLKGTFSIKQINGSIFELLADACRRLGLRQIGFEERNLVYAKYKKIKEVLGKETKLIPTHNLIEELRQIKEQAELAKIKIAIQITAKALKYIENLISAGKKEIEMVAELERFIRYQGANSSAFDIIVACGPNSGFPHHTPGQRKIRNNEPVLVDLGVDYQGYKCDLTRVFFLDKINVLTKKVYSIVLEAQKRAINKIKPGIKVSEIDKVGHNFIAQEGYGKFFGHNLGHGIGLEVHEEPRICGKSATVLKPGMIFTVEPAIYLPAKFGIRIEDMVLVTKKGCEVLSGAIHK